MGAYEGSNMQAAREDLEKDNKRRAESHGNDDGWRCQCGRWVVPGERYSLPGGDKYGCCLEHVQMDPPVKASKHKAKQYPEAPGSRKLAAEFMDEFKAASGYDLAAEFEADLRHALETWIDNEGFIEDEGRGEPMAWRK